jgi:septum formation protein
MTKLILASSSERRVTLLKQIRFYPDVIHPADIDETPLKTEAPKDYVLRVAKAKALAVAEIYKDDVILAGDTTVVLGTRILGKPQDENEAKKFMQLLSGRRHKVLSSVAVIKGDIKRSKVVCTYVKFKNLSEEDINLLVDAKDWEGKAGGYMIQGLAGAFVTQISGSISNVIGLPLAETYNLLKSVGLKPSLQ